MIIKSIRLAIRRLWIFKLNSFISIGGLAVAIAVALAIFSYTYHHYSFDRHIKDGENSYRLISRYGQGTFNANTFACFDDVLPEFDEVKSYTTAYTSHNVQEVHVGDEKFEIEDVIFVDTNALEFFSMNMVLGDVDKIGESNIAFITPQFATKLFGTDNPMNKQIFIRSFTPQQDSLLAFTIGGIIKEAPQSSHLKYDLLFSQKGHFSSIIQLLKNRKVFGASIYMKLPDNIDIQAFQEKLKPRLIPLLESVPGPPLDVMDHQLQALYDIHFTDGLTAEQQSTIRFSSLQILLLVGLVILLLAAFNFGIIHIARAEYHRKANFITRLMSGSKWQLFFQTFTEILISTFIALVIAIYLLAAFQHFGDTEFFGNYSINFLSSEFIFILVAILLILSLLITILSTTDLWRSQSLLNEVNHRFKKRIAVILMMSQFSIVIVLIGFTILINKQMQFIDDKDLGYKANDVMIIKVPQRNGKVEILRQELQDMTFVSNAANAHHYPGYRLQDMNFSNSGSDFPFKFGFIDKYTLATLEIDVLQYFNERESDATDGWYINESFYHQLLLSYSHEQIANSDFPTDQEDGESDEFVILGVMHDFHYASLHDPIENFAFHIPKEDSRINRFLLLSYDANQEENAIINILGKTKEIFPDLPIRYEFMEEEVALKYQSENTLLKLINLFSLLSIIVACFGLIGLMVFVSNQRTKEIGIRKVNGASISEILMMLNKEVIIWISISFLVATPISFLIARKWLENFAFKTDVSWWIFVIAGLIAFLIGLITVSWQSYKAARRNPVEALRYE